MLLRAAGLPFDRLSSLSADWKTADTAVAVGETRMSDLAVKLQMAFDQALNALDGLPVRTVVYNARRAFFTRRKLPAGATLEALQASAGLPGMDALLECLQNYTRAQSHLQEARNQYAAQYQEVLEAGFRHLQLLVAEPDLQRALLFTSHSLLRQLPGFVNKPPEKWDKKDRQTALSLLQYTCRMVAKTSPMSYWTTVSIQEISGDTSTEQTPAISVAPNVALLEFMYSFLLQDPVFFRSLDIVLNPCIIDVPENNLQWLVSREGSERFQEAAAEPVLQLITDLMLRHGRCIPFQSLVQQLAGQVDATIPDLEAHILQLVEVGLLEWELPVPGFSPDWCVALHSYLSTLSDSITIQATQRLLQVMVRTANRLHTVSVQEAIMLQNDVLQQVQAYFSVSQATAPPIPVEQVFYTDVSRPVALDIPQKITARLAGQLRECWQECTEVSLPAERAAVYSFAQGAIKPGETIGFQEFARAYLAAEHPQPASFKLKAVSGGRVGALLQVFRQEDRWQAVVNGLFPGGGKMFARWLPLFSPAVSDALKEWQMRQPGLSPFPWQGYFNANFQPCPAEQTGRVPGGRLRAKDSDRELVLGNIDVTLLDGLPVLVDRSSGRQVIWTDLGLEAPEARPPAMRLLWYLGLPYVSRQALVPDDRWKEVVPGVFMGERVTWQDLVLDRAVWRLMPDVWTSWLERGRAHPDFFRLVRAELAGLSVPRRFFARFAGVRPQYFDQDSPVSQLLFQKMLRTGAGELYLTEMLPLPEEAVLGMATELVLEMEV